MRSVKIKEVVDALEQFAPLPLQEDYDNAGLQVGLTEVDLSGALLCLDVTEATVDEAIAHGCNLIVSHHPLIFHKLARVSDGSYVERIVAKAIKNDITIVAMHTNMDAVEGGVNFKIAEKLGLGHLEFIGKEQTVVDANGTPRHGGEGIIGTLPEQWAADDLVIRLKQTFEVECVETNELLRRPIRRIALCGGAGSFLLDEAVARGADAFITGEMGYHQFFGREQQVQICVIGHYQSEQFTPEIFQKIIKSRFPDAPCYISEINTNPILYM